MSSLVSGADVPSVWLPRVGTTRVVVKQAVREAARSCTGKGCMVQKSVTVKRESNRWVRLRFWR